MRWTVWTRRQQKRRLKIRRMKRKRQNPEITGPGKYQINVPWGIEAGEAAEPEEASGPDQEPDQPLFVETRRSYDGEWKDQRCLLRSRWDGLYVPVDGWDTLKDGLDQYNAEVSQETGERFKENLSLVREDPPEPGQEYYIEREIRVQRADSRIVSFWDMDSSYVGGAMEAIMPME